MTTTQEPKALELADRHKYRVRALDSGWNAKWNRSTDEFDLCVQSAAELSRQHAEIDRLMAAIETERTARQAAHIRIEELQAQLVRADAERCKAVAAEREACAVVCEARAKELFHGAGHGAALCADAIRARGSQ